MTMQGSRMPRPLTELEGETMSQVSDLTARLLQVQRQRDQLRMENLRLRDKLLEWAAECASCDGKGVVTIIENIAMPGRQEVCGDCLDIRELLS